MSSRISVPELKRMSPDELRKEVYLRRAECAKMRIGLKSQSEKNHAAYREKRREIARMLTVMGQQSLNPVKMPENKKIEASQTGKNDVKSAGLKVVKRKTVPTKSEKSPS